jgi:pilus assembly protein CpaB
MVIMRGKTLVTALFIVTLTVAAFAVFNLMHKGDASEPRHHVLVATVALPSGTLLRSQDVEWHAVSQTEADQIVRPTAVEAKPDIVQEVESRVYGAVLRHPLADGTPIRRGDIVRPGDRDFLQIVLTPGARAIAIPVTTGGASTGLLSPGDRVDIILTQNFKNDSAQDMRNTPVTRRSVSETVVQNLRVLAIDAIETKPVVVANGGFGRTVTLEVTPDQVEKINVAAELGKLSVSLRSTLVAAVASTGEAVKPQWAGDVSPALFGAAQEKPTAIAPRPIQVIRGSKTQEAVKPEN